MIPIIPLPLPPPVCVVYYYERHHPEFSSSIPFYGKKVEKATRDAWRTSSMDENPKKKARIETMSKFDRVAQIRALVANGATDAELLQVLMRPLVNDPAPEISGCQALMPSGEFGTISLASYAGKWKVLFFYPLDFTFVCPTEIIAFGDRQSEFSAVNTQVIAASCDSAFTHLAWTNTQRSEGGLGKMQIPILADFTKEIATAYGVCPVDGGNPGCPLRGVFIIDPSNVVRSSTINDYPVG